MYKGFNRNEIREEDLLIDDTVKQKPRAHIRQRDQGQIIPITQKQKIISTPPQTSQRLSLAYIDRVLRNTKQPQPKSSYVVIHK
jgi:hypothetical protein